MSNINSNVYVDTIALLDWKSRMNIINNNSIEKVKQIKEKMEELDSCMAGNIAEGIKHDIGEFTKKSLSLHESMKDIEKMLQEIVDKRTQE